MPVSKISEFISNVERLRSWKLKFWIRLHRKIQKTRGEKITDYKSHNMSVNFKPELGT